MGESINTFTELNTDFHAVNTQPTVMSDAVNAALTTRGENQLILQNLKGNKNITKLSAGFQVLAVTTFKDIAYIVSAKYDDDGVFELGEIGTYPSPDWAGLFSTGEMDPNYYLPLVPEYQPIKNFSTSEEDFILSNDINYNEGFTTNMLNFGSGLLELEAQPSYDESVNLIITDDINPIKLINVRFRLDDSGKNAALADRRQIKDTNTYSEKRFSGVNLIRQSDTIVKLTFEGVKGGGSHVGGGYRFFFRYVDSDGSLTNIIEESRLVSFAHDDYGAKSSESTGKMVRFTLSNLDRKFTSIKVYYSYASGTTATTTTINEITNDYAINEDSTTITIYGDETFTSITRSSLNIDYSTIDSAKTMAQFNDRLLIANTSSTTEDYDYFKEVTSLLTIEEDTTPLKIKELGSGYADPENVYHKLGYWDGETYQLGIVFILKDGRGLSPVTPIRGINNYNGTKKGNYTTDPDFLASGFVGKDDKSGDSENNLGVYRTTNGRTQLESDEETTNIKYLKVDISPLLDDDIIKESTAGFFFVRRERIKDCLVQGLITTTCAESITPAYSLNDDFFSQSTSDNDWKGIQENIADIRDGAGKASTDLEGGKYKILPAPGQIYETSFHSGNGYVDKNKGDSITIQGKTNSLGDYQKFLAFYSADMLVDPQYFASMFNNTNKGIMCHYEPAKMYQTIAPDAEFEERSYGQLQYNKRKLEVDGNTKVGGTDFYGLKAQRNEEFLLIDTGTNVTRSTMEINIFDPSDNDAGNTIAVYNVPVEIFLGVGPNNNQIIGELKKTSNLTGNNIVNGGYITSYHTGTGGRLTFEGVQWESQSGELSDTLNTAISTRFSNGNSEPDGPDYYIDRSVSVEGALEGSPITNLKSRRQEFNPSLLYPADGGRKNLMRYIGSGQEGFANEDFASVSDRNLYYASKLGWQDGGDDKDWKNGNITSSKSHSSAFFVTNTTFSDYVGIKLSHKDPTIEKLNHANDDESNAVFNFRSNMVNGSGITGTDIGDYVYNVQEKGIKLGLLSNIYEDPDGYMKQPEWITQNESTSFSSGYTAITERYNWDDFSRDNSDSVIDIFDGDCYVNYTYKRTSYPLGIPGVATATDPTLYIDGNQDTGLSDKGFVFPIITQNNYNTALRTLDKVDEVETLLYGKDRTFFPVEDIDVLRGSKQPESTGYNFGYNFNFSDRLYYILNANAPTFNINYGNRIMVSSPSISGNFSNGYTDFSGINYRDYNKHLGEITKLISHNNEVFCIFESGLGVVPINQRTMISQDTGGVFLDDAEVIAQKMNVISSEYGSSQQFSIVKSDTHIYGVDYSKNKIWRITKSTETGKSGVEVISDFAVQSALNLYKETLETNNGVAFVKGNYDRSSNDVTFTFLNKENHQYKSNESNKISSIVYNETLGKWVTRLSWNPLHVFNLSNNMISVNAIAEKGLTNILWDHYSKDVKHCHFYGEQEKFIFEFVLVDNPSIQKILDNMLVICNRAFPGRVTYGLLEDDIDYETLDNTNNGRTQLLKQRHEPAPLGTLTLGLVGGKAIFRVGDISEEEAERIVGAYILHDEKWYIVGPKGGSDSFYHEILDQNGNNVVGGVPIGWTFTELHYGIIHQNMEYVEDHLYVEVGSDDSKPRVRDKAIRVRFMYEGYDYVTIQTIISSFTYSFN